ncbi:NAD(P)-dependent alcohol dehydrogenase [Breoghania sp. L-A4]|uniref:zinc-dependent alcohol dehydrogenase family protein n=1 Tax=Breoghania sp. L-A4 TaxID=2304600 RepID=UPI000E359128|nr:NAD(P)-dependent alcohol dehydrogenase [Breoghania sp. L-A4]AXS39300.1 NAD(P)-dependent alcohol dehydrogenase [Breoghania sp. L-A4]
MRKLVLENTFGFDGLSLVACDEPAPGHGQVCVRVGAVSLNYRDLLFVEGSYNPRARLPAVPVSDCAGVVTSVGPGVVDLKPGDRVVNLFMENWAGGTAAPGLLSGSRGGGDKEGVAAEFVCFDESALLPVPDHLSLAEAACLPCAAITAWSAVADAETVKPGAAVLVQGSGGVALFALQFARIMGARTVLVSSSNEKLESVAHLQPDHVINYQETPAWAKPARAALAPDGFDLVVEIGGAATLEQSLRAVRVGGTVAMIGVVSGATAPLNLPLAVMRQVRLQGVTVGSRAAMADMLRAIEVHGLRPHIHAIVPLEDHRQAFALMKAGGHTGKIVMSLE